MAFNGPQRPGAPNPLNPLGYVGTSPNMTVRNRRPTPMDGLLSPLGSWWIVPIDDTFKTGEVWVLVSVAEGIATWKRLRGSGIGPVTDFTVNKIYLTTAGSGSYTPSNGLVQAYVECIGAGGASATCSTPYHGTALQNAGGGGGAYCAKLYTAADIGTSVSYVIGAGGTAPLTQGDGNDGGDTTFLGMTAGGGSGAIFLGGPPPTPPRQNEGGYGGVATGGDINDKGGWGFTFYNYWAGSPVPDTSYGWSGGSFYSASKYGLRDTASASVTCEAGIWGAGGGCYALNNGGPGLIIGGSGGDGVIIITEYIG